jgi:hypothetical protein
MVVSFGSFGLWFLIFDGPFSVFRFTSSSSQRCVSFGVFGVSRALHSRILTGLKHNVYSKY